MPDDAVFAMSATWPVNASLAMRLPLSLADLPLGTFAHVAGVRPATGDEGRELLLRLLEIGFVEGEPVRVIAVGFPGHEPIAVRVGGTTFALRRFEAEQVLVTSAEADSAGCAAPNGRVKR